MSIFSYDIKTEGKEPFQKLKAACKLAVLGSGVTGGYETLVAKPSPNFNSAFAQYGRHALLWTAVTTSFTTTVLFLTHMRKKDDPWNYFFAANASCGVFYSITKQGRAAFALGVITGIGAAMLKAAHLRGYDPFDYSDVRSDRYRFGLVYENSPDVRYAKEN